ncbi:MAG: hypothetical protein ACRDCE_14615 [Cetobacterium sp.]|uniref:hypothetical protein n=1 Tax=Cetobacterium sp. TaxID=2071632 RepID=UPI003EE7AD8D
MAVFRMRTLGQFGVIKDLPPFELPPNTWSDSVNVRFAGGRVQKFGGNHVIFDKNQPSGEKPLNLVQRSNREEIVYGTNKSLYLLDGGAHTNISQLKEGSSTSNPEYVEYDASEDFPWYYTTLSNSMVFCNEKNNPQGLRPLDMNFSELPGWGYPFKPDSYDDNGNPVYSYQKKQWKSPRIRAYKNYLVALGMYEGSTFYPQRVRWSDVSYVNDLPTNWYENDPNKDGGFNDLSDSIGTIIDGVPLRDSFIIYTDRDTFIMDYVGGDYIFNWRKLFSDSGILAPNCAVEFEGQHFVVSESDIFVHNGSNRKSVVTGRNKEFLISEISNNNPLATKVFALEASKEIWVCYVSGRQRIKDNPSLKEWGCNKAAVWNWEYDTWTFYDIPALLDVNLGLPQEEDIRRWDEFAGTEASIVGDPPDGVYTDSSWPDGSSDFWDDESHSFDVWSAEGKTFKRQVVYGISDFGKFYLLDDGETFTYYNQDDYDNPRTRPLPVMMERKSLDFDEQVEQINRFKFIKRIYPQFTGSGSVRFYVGGSNDPESPPTWDGSSEFVIGEDYKVDCFSNYRYISIRLTDLNKGQWSLTGMDVEYITEGRR